MAPTSDGKRKTKNKAKVTLPKRTQAGNQLSRESPIPDPASEREPTNPSRTPSLAQSDRDNPATGPSAGPSNGADVTRYEYDPSWQVRSEPEAGEGEELSSPAVQEDGGENQGADVHQRIAERAFLLYAEGGFQDGQDLDHWLEAEREILNGR